MQKSVTLAVVVVCAIATGTQGQGPKVNYDESKVPEYTLPDPLTFNDGSPVESAAAWGERRRAEVLELFQQHVYGRTPQGHERVHAVQQPSDPEALGGLATRKEVLLHVGPDGDGEELNLLVYVPNDASWPVPVIVGLNFHGNHTIHTDPGISLASSWIRNREQYHITDNKASEALRGTRASQWAIDRIIERGYALATVYYGDIDPDRPGYWSDGIHPLFYRKEQTQPESNEWGSIGAWAWGLSRVADYIETDADLDEDRMVLFGHSRLGKTSLWAGAQDQRFAVVISNNSGCGGAALSRRAYGETVEMINNRFPHWFNDEFTRYNGNEGDIPVDQHMLITLIAPRPVYVASAEDDKWSDPKGEFLSAKHASTVYELLGLGGLSADDMPGIHRPVSDGSVGYHIRAGKHGVTEYDWERFMDFADRHLGGF